MKQEIDPKDTNRAIAFELCPTVARAKVLYGLFSYRRIYCHTGIGQALHGIQRDVVEAIGSLVPSRCRVTPVATKDDVNAFQRLAHELRHIQIEAFPFAVSR